MQANADDRAIEVALLRRQLLLAAAVAVILIASVALFLWASAGVQPGRAVLRPLYYAGSDPLVTAHVLPHPSSHWLTRAAVMGATATALVLGLAVTHVVRVATFTFRKGDR